jgi:hypothetical protein
MFSKPPARPDETLPQIQPPQIQPPDGVAPLAQDWLFAHAAGLLPGLAGAGSEAQAP